MKTIKYIAKINNIFKQENFILSAINLAFLSYYMDERIKITKWFILWPDGIYSKLFFPTKKISGSTLISKLKLPKNIKNIVVVGNLNKNNYQYLYKRFKIKINYKKIPKISEKRLEAISLRLNKNTICIITLPTPKQEILANTLSKKNKFFKIICIGGGLDIASGTIKGCPKFLSGIGLEFVWRLRTDTIRRIARLLETFIKFNYNFLKGKMDLKFKKF